VIISTSPLVAAPNPRWSWLSFAANGANAYVGSGIRNPEFSDLGFEIGTCISNQSNPSFSFDVLGIKDTSDNISLYAGLGINSSPNDNSAIIITGSGGVWFHFDQTKLGLGYHSARGAELKLGLTF
jgi:hypothetical protein